MFRFLFGRKGAVPAAPQPHPVLAQMLAAADGLRPVFTPTQAHFLAVTAALRDAPATELMTIALQALVRLPDVRLGYPQQAADPHSVALRTAVEKPTGVTGALRAVSPEEMTAACGAMVQLLSRDWETLADWPDAASSLFVACLAPDLCPRSAASDQALRTVLDRLGHGAPIADIRIQIARLIVERLGLPPEASPTLRAVQGDTAKRDALRARMLGTTGPALAPLAEALLDSKLRWSGQKEFAALPDVASFMANDPATLGAALLIMHTILRDCPGPDYPDLSWLARPNGAYNPQPYLTPTIYPGFELLPALILRKRIDIADTAMATLIRERVIQRRASNDPYRSTPFLNQALKVAASDDGRETRAALAWLLAYQPVAEKMPIPTEWKHPVQEALIGAAPVTALVPPSLDLALLRYDNWYGPHGNTEVIKLTRHFQTLFDPSLHDGAHRAFLASIGPAVAARRARLNLDAATMERVQAEVRATPPRGPAWDNVIARLEELKNDQARAGVLDVLLSRRDLIAAEAALIAPFIARHPAAADRLSGLFEAILNKSGPTGKWLTDGAAALEHVPESEGISLLRDLIAVAGKGPADSALNEHHARGLIYLAHRWNAALIGPLLADFALRDCFQTEPGKGIRNEKLGNACLWALIHMPDGAGVPFLARMLAQVKYPKVRTRIDAALNEAAAAAGITRGALDEITVPDHGLDAQGQLAFAIGGGQAILTLTGNRDTDIRWISPEGKPLKAPNTPMKDDKEAMKQVRAAAKEIETDLATQIIRLQRLYLDDRRWSLADWRSAYLDHPLMGRLTRHLLWWVERDGVARAALPQDATLTDITGQPVPTEGATIRLWHPIDAEPADVLAWRDRIEALGLVQPFAQIWREIYRLTDAERTTGTYSNRWAGHILKQHQAMTLARLTGWTVTHRMWVDVENDEPWHILLPTHRLVADYWVEGAGDPDDPERLDSNAYVYVTSDRVAFSRVAEGAALRDSAHGPARAEPVPLTDVPPLVLSEVMRHCDLFTAVASIASDPLWRDRGAGAEHPNQWRRAAEGYWERQSFGELTEAARLRHALLARIVPKLAIADRCTLEEDGLIVRGTRHEYRIHLGSAAIRIMDQQRHLCIVPAANPKEERYYVPFEGDRTLSVIVSKALLLAADEKIKDPDILSQI